MKRFILMGLMATTAACNLSGGNSSYTDLPTQKDGTPGKSVCGLPGERGKVGFSYFDCVENPTINGEPFGQTLAAGSSVPIYIDSPSAQITKATSSNESVATVALHRPPGAKGVYVSVQTFKAGATKIVLRTGFDGSGDIVDQVSIGVVDATDLRISGMPQETAFALLDFASVELCAQPLHDDQPIAGSNVVQMTADDGLSVNPVPSACASWGGESAVDGQGYLISALSSEPQTFTVSIPGVERTFEISSVEQKDLTDIVFDPPALTVKLAEKTVPSFTVAFRAGNLPVIGADCAMTATGSSDMDWFVQSTQTSQETQGYIILPNRLSAGQYTLTCSVDDGRLQKSMAITVQ